MWGGSGVSLKTCRMHQTTACLRLCWIPGTVEGSPSIAQLFTHIHFVRLVFVLEDAPEFARNLPEEESCWPDRLSVNWEWVLE